MPKIVDHDKMRRDIVERSLVLFADRGYAALTIRSIAQSLQVSTGTLYHYFDRKESLFLAVADFVVELDASGTEMLIALPQEQRLPLMLAYVDAHQDRFLHHWLVLADVLRLDDHSEILGRIKAASQRYAIGIAATLGLKSAAKGELFLALVNGLLLHAQVSEPVCFADHEPLFRTVLYDNSNH